MKDCMTGSIITYHNNDTFSGKPTPERSYRVEDVKDFRRIIRLAMKGKIKIVTIDCTAADYLKEQGEE